MKLLKYIKLVIIAVFFIGCKAKTDINTSIKEFKVTSDIGINTSFKDSIKFYNKLKEIKVQPKTLSLLFIGDFMGHMDQINAAYDKETKTYNYDECFSKIKPIISNADVTLGNMEVTLGVKPYSGYPQFSSPPSYAAAVKKIGVDVLTTANNHSCDKGKRGVENTIRVLDSLNIGHTGTFKNIEEKLKNPAYIIRKNGFKIAVINYTYGTNGIKPRLPNVVNYLDKETIKADVDLINSSIKPDQIIAFVHWGYQYKNLPNKSQKELFEYFKSVGVNIVIGAHPHVLQPMKWQKPVKDSISESLVVYSLGNFVSHQRTFPRDGGAVFKLLLEKTAEGNVKIKDANYVLTWVHEPIIAGKKQYYVLPANAYSKKPAFFKLKKDYDKMQRFIKHARTLLGNENLNIEENLN